MLGSGIHTETGHTDLSNHRRGVHNPASMFEDGGDFVLHAEEETKHVDIERVPVILLRLLVRGHASGAFDARIVEGEIQPPKLGHGLVHERLYISFPADVRFNEQRLPAKHPLAKQKVVRLKSLASEPFVQFHRKGAPGLFDEVIATCRRTGFSPRIVNEPNFMATVMTLVESGLGVSLIPRCVRSLNRPHVVICPITPKSERIPLCVAWRKSANNPTLTEFLELLRAAIPSIKTQMES